MNSTLANATARKAAGADRAKQQCGFCGKAASANRILFAYQAPVHEQDRPSKDQSARLDMPLCHACGERVLKHLKRMFSLQQLGIRPNPKAPVAWSAEL